MGKVQSKQGECFVVNAHFNPVCQIDENTRSGVSYSDGAHKLSGISEMSLSISRDNILLNQKMGLKGEEKFPLNVVMPQEVRVSPKTVCNEMTKRTAAAKEDEDWDRCPEKAEEEKSEKEEKQKMKSLGKISCDVSLEDLEKQEFSFTLYDFNGHGKVTKDDAAGLVRSIYDALGKSVKLPPSGSRTIKVHLTVSPDGPFTVTDSKTTTQECIYRATNPVSVQEEPSSSKKHPTPDQPVIGTGSEPSVHTLSTYINSTVDQLFEKNLLPDHHRVQLAGGGTTAVPNVTAPCKKAQNAECSANFNSEPVKEMLKEKIPYHRMYDVGVDRHGGHRHHHRHHYNFVTNREHVPECRARRNHYLDLEGAENCASFEPIYSSPYTMTQHFPSSAAQQNLCPCLDRTGLSYRDNAQRDFAMHREKLHEHGSRFLKSQLYSRKEDLLNLNFDLCDIAPEEKFDWECCQHRRSKSYDTYDKKLENHLSSPRVKQKLYRQGQVNANAHNRLPLPQYNNVSPNHHYKHKHREREYQRAMQQVAHWIENNKHSGGYAEEGHYTSSRETRRMETEAQYYHHLHEHVHHHYHHYTDH